MKKTFLTIFIVLFSLAANKSIFADDFSDAIIKARAKFDSTSSINDVDGMLKARGDFQRILQLKKNQWLVNYYLGSVDVVLAYTAMRNQNNDDVKKYTESALMLLDKCTDEKDDFAEAWILKVAAESNRWQYESDKMQDIISKQTDAKTKAKKLDPDNPRYYLIDAMITYYTPAAFGGGYDKAMPVFKTSWDKFQTYKPVDDTYPNWGRDQAAGMIAMCYIQDDKLTDAKSWMDKGLEASPNSGFIKNYVQGEYDKKANSK